MIRISPKPRSRSSATGVRRPAFLISDAPISATMSKTRSCPSDAGDRPAILEPKSDTHLSIEIVRPADEIGGVVVQRLQGVFVRIHHMSRRIVVVLDVPLQRLRNLQMPHFIDALI